MSIFAALIMWFASAFVQIVRYFQTPAGIVLIGVGVALVVLTVIANIRHGRRERRKFRGR